MSLQHGFQLRVVRSCEGSEIYASLSSGSMTRVSIASLREHYFLLFLSAHSTAVLSVASSAIMADDSRIVP